MRRARSKIRNLNDILVNLWLMVKIHQRNLMEMSQKI